MAAGIYDVTIRIRLEADMEPEEVQEMMEDIEFDPGSKAGTMIEQWSVVEVQT